jgi:long-subunit fatty acid transport protein
VICALGTVVACPAVAWANTEPNAYDTRSVALAQSGVAFLERPAAIAINPALLTGVDKSSFSVMFNPIIVNTCAPVQGPGSKDCTGPSLGPLGSVFFAWRLTERMVWGAGAYVEVGYGATYDAIRNLDGEPDEVVGTDPQDLTVGFFIGEFAVGPAIAITDQVSVGVMLRLPVSFQGADTYQNVGAVSVLPNPTYTRVRSGMGGVGVPSVRLGLSYKPNDMWTLGAAWRAYTRIDLSGTTESDLSAPGLETLDAQSAWVVPNALQFGASVTLVDKKLLLVAEIRMQFHEAKRQGNQTQIVVVSVPPGSPPGLEDLVPDATVAPFYWKNVYALKTGAEYQVIELLALRLGFGIGNSNTREEFAQIFTNPPGITMGVTGGIGFNWDKVDFDLATLFFRTKYAIGPEVAENPVMVDGELINLCSRDQVIRTGCAGDYTQSSYWLSAQVTYHY